MTVYCYVLEYNVKFSKNNKKNITDINCGLFCFSKKLGLWSILFVCNLMMQFIKDIQGKKKKKKTIMHTCTHTTFISIYKTVVSKIKRTHIDHILLK